MLQENTTIAFIGAGNMANALIEGLIANGMPAGNLWATDTDPEKLASLSQRGINTLSGNTGIPEEASIVILAVKPQVMAGVLGELESWLGQHDCLLISIAAGIQMKSLQAWTHPEQSIIRCMPNTPALVQTGASALFANANASEEQKRQAGEILKAVGIVCWLNREEEMDAVTALSGSGPAYFFLLMEAMIEAGVELGLAPEAASKLCLQTALGAAKLAIESDVDVAELRRRVTSPGGTTEAALRQFESDRFNDMVGRALEKAAQRSRELATSGDSGEKDIK